jgi:hypothetical protein
MGALRWKVSSRRTKVQALRVMTTISPVILGACSTVGTTSIDWGRTPYNQVIHDTSAQQALLNIARVSNSETPLFMDVTEVDAATTFGASISGGPSGLGATPDYKTTTAGTIAGSVGFITGGATYFESPTVRYQPLLGQPLIAQVSTPLDPDALTNLYNSDWSLSAILTLGIDRLTPGYMDYSAAVNAIADLDQYGAIILAASASPRGKQNDEPKNFTIAYNQQPTKNDIISIYYEPNRIYTRQARCDGKSEKDATTIVGALWSRLKNIYNPRTNNLISISSKGRMPPSKDTPVQPATKESLAPVLRTRSALGIMKDAAEQDGYQRIEITGNLEKVRKLVTAHNAHRHDDCVDDFYMVDPDPTLADHEEYEELSRRIHAENRSMITMYPNKSELSPEEAKIERDFTHLRRYMLIVSSDTPPNGAFVSVYDNGKYYSIFNDDEISKKTLALISQFNTILAIPSQSAPLTPTISVGARM